jgi:hypothetical protein
MPNESSELHKLFTNPQESFSPQTPSANEELPDELKNRHIKRLEAKLQAEREANIASAARIEALSEARKLQQETSIAGWEEKARRIYGNEKPENAAASDLLVDALKEATAQARKDTIEEIRREMQAQNATQERESKAVTDSIEQIEDQFGVDFTSNQAALERQKEFKDLWFRLSAKDSNGKVKEYADPFEVFRLYNGNQTNSAKDYASRGLQRSQPMGEGVQQDDATTKYLRENGILDPF